MTDFRTMTMKEPLFLRACDFGLAKFHWAALSLVILPAALRTGQLFRCACRYWVLAFVVAQALLAAEEPALVPHDTAEAARYWSKRLTPGFPAHTRLLAVESLEILALEAWEPDALKTSLEGLASVINDPDPEVARCRYALNYRISHARLPAWAREIVTDFFVSLLRSEDPGRQRLGVEALCQSQMETQEVTHLLDTMLVSEDRELSGFAGGMLLGQANSDPEAMRRLGQRMARLLETGSSQRKVRLVQHLQSIAANLGDVDWAAKAEAEVLGLLRDTDPEVRQSAIRLISSFASYDQQRGRQGGVNWDELVNSLLQDPTPTNAMYAANLLGNQARRTSNADQLAEACAVFTRFLADPNASTRMQALALLRFEHWCWLRPVPAGIPDHRAPSGWGQYYPSYGPGPWRLEPLLVPAWTKQLYHEDLRVRYAAMRLISQSGADDIPAAFREHFPVHKASVLLGLGSPDPLISSEAWRSALNVEFLKAGTVQAIGPPFRDALRRGEAEEVNRLLKQFGGASLAALLDGPSAEGMGLLVALARSFEPTTRIAAARALTSLVDRPDDSRGAERNALLLRQLEPMPDPKDSGPYVGLPGAFAELALDPVPQVSVSGWAGLLLLRQQNNWLAVAADADANFREAVQKASSLARSRLARALQPDDLHRLSSFRSYRLATPSAWEMSFVEQLLRPLLQDPVPRTQAEAVLALVSFGISVPEEPLAKLDPETRQVAAALRAKQLRNGADLGGRQLVESLDDPSSAVRLAASLRLSEPPMAMLLTNEVLAGRVYREMLDTLKVPGASKAANVQVSELFGRLFSMGEILPHLQGLGELAERVEISLGEQGEAVGRETLELLVNLGSDRAPPEVAKRMFPLAIALAESGPGETRLIVLPVLGSLVQRSWSFGAGARHMPTEVTAQAEMAYRLLVNALSDPASRMSAAETLAGTKSWGSAYPPEAVMQSVELRQEALASIRRWADEEPGGLNFDACLLAAYLRAEQRDAAGTEVALDQLVDSVFPEGHSYAPGQPQREQQMSHVAEVLTQLAIGSPHVDVRQVASVRLLTFLQGLRVPGETGGDAMNDGQRDDGNLAGNAALRIESLLRQRPPASPEEFGPLVLLIRRWSQSGNTYAAQNASKALSTMLELGMVRGGEDYLSEVLRLAQSADSAERKQAAATIGRLMPGNRPGLDTSMAAFEKRAGPIVLELIKDSDPGVRDAAYQALDEGTRLYSADRLGISSTQWREAIVAGLRDEEETVQVTAANALLHSLSSAGQRLNTPEWQRLAEEFVVFLARVPDSEVAYDFEYSQFREVVAMVRDPAVRANTTRILKQRINAASEPHRQAALSRLLGELYLVWDSPAEAVGRL
jgi:hypothetical protein